MRPVLRFGLVFLVLTLALSGAVSARSAQGEQPRRSAAEMIDADIRFERITNEDGLSVSVVYALAQDRQGFLWFGSEDGLNRYDGKEFVVYKHDPDNPDSLGHNWVDTLLVDRDGRLWIGTTGGGLDGYDPSSGHFTHYRYAAGDPASLGSDMVDALFEDRRGRLWVGTDMGLDRLDRQTGRFSHLKDDPTAPALLGQAGIRQISEDSQGRLWFSTTQGLVQYDPAAGRYQVYQNKPGDPASLSFDNVTAALEDHAGRVWVATRGGGLNRLDPLSGRFEHFKSDPADPASLSSSVITSLYEDRNGVLWVGTWGWGLNRYDEARQRFIRYWNEPANPNSLGGNFILGVFEDDSGAVWVSTWGAGLSRFDHLSEQFAHYRSRPDDPLSLSSPMIWALYADGDTLWVGHQMGLDRLDRQTGQAQPVDLKMDDPKLAGKPAVQGISKDRAGNLWLAVSQYGLVRYNPLSGETQRYHNDPNDPHSLISNAVIGALEDASGQIWVGTHGGLDRLDAASGAFTHFTADEKNPDALSSNWINSIYLDRAGNLWTATEKGVNRLDPRTGKFTHYVNDPANPRSLSSNRVAGVSEDRAGRIWIGTIGGGVNRLDPASGEIKIYREKEGLPNDTVYSVLEDEAGQLWISTNRGLARFDPQRETFKNYDVRDGLQSNEFNSGAFFKSASGELFFGGIDGVTAFDPQAIHENPYVPPVALVSLTQGGQPFRASAPPAGLNQADFRWPNNFFEFQFAALSYIQPDQNQYAYKLEGFDRDWNYTRTNNLGRYTNLPGGTYTLRLKAANNDGVWNEQGASLRIRVIPPFWQTWWFRGGLLGLLALAGLGVYRLRVRGIEARTRQLETLVDERTREIERRHRELEALYRADEALYRNLQLEQVLQALVDSAVDLLQADKGSLLVWDDAHTRLAARVGRGFSPASLACLSFAPGEGVAGSVGVSGEPALVENVTAEPRVSRAVTDPEGIRAFMQVPIKVGGEIFGVFSADYLQPRAFSENDLRLLISLAQRAALAIQNAQLYEHTQEQAIVEERNRLARELHDAVTQTLFSASLLAEALPTAWESSPSEGQKLLGELRQLSRGALAEMRTLLMELRPSALAEADLGDLLRQLGEAAAGREGIPVTVALDGRCELPTDVHIALYRIAQEALNNALKHARASQISLHLRRRPPDEAESDLHPEVILTIRDDGRGFDPERIAPNHFGLGIMRERADAIGATLTVESQPGCGAQITALWEGTNSKSV